MNDEYITVAKFAERAGVSRQTVYNKLSKVDSEFYRKFVKVDNGKKYINVKAVKLFSADKKSQRKVNIDGNFDDDLTAILHRHIDALQADKTFLQEQLAAVTKSLQFEQRKVDELQRLLQAPKPEEAPEQEEAPIITAETTEKAESERKTMWERLMSWIIGE